jgi:hypothetical protein
MPSWGSVALLLHPGFALCFLSLPILFPKKSNDALIHYYIPCFLLSWALLFFSYTMKACEATKVECGWPADKIQFHMPNKT